VFEAKRVQITLIDVVLKEPPYLCTCRCTWSPSSCIYCFVTQNTSQSFLWFLYQGNSFLKCIHQLI